MRNIVEPLLGWLFVAVVMVILAAVMLTVTRPRTEVSGHSKVHLPH